MKKWLTILCLIPSLNAQAIECQPPGQGFLENKVKEVFQANLGETELKELMLHPKNANVRQSLKELDRRTKFTSQRLDRERLQTEALIQFEQALQNTQRTDEFDHFPVVNSISKMSGSAGALTIEMSNLPKDELDVLPPEVLKKLDPKIKINYFYPYDKYEYFLTYDGKELPMQTALNKVQADMETECDLRVNDNNEYRRWYKKTHGGDATRADTGVKQGSGGQTKGAGQ